MHLFFVHWKITREFSTAEFFRRGIESKTQEKESREVEEILYSKILKIKNFARRKNVKFIVT